MRRPTMGSARVGHRLRAGVTLAAVTVLCVACGGAPGTTPDGAGSSVPASVRATGSLAAPSSTPTPTTSASGSQPVAPPSHSPSPDSTPAAYVSSSGVVGRWVALGRLPGGGVVDRLVALPDGRILMTGTFPGPETRALVFDPIARTWTPSPVEIDPRDAVVVRPDGSVFVAGASDATAWRDLAYGVGSDHPSRHGLAPSAAALDDGRILVAGGCIQRKAASGKRVDDPPVGGDAIRAAEIRDLDPSTGRDEAAPTGDLGRARVGAPAATLADGRVLVAGSVTAYRFWLPDGGGDAVCAPDPAGDAEWTADVWDPATGRFIPTGAIPEPDRAAVAALGIDAPDGRPRVDDGGRLVPLLDGGALLLDRRESWSVGVEDPRTESWPVVTQVTRSLRYDAATDTWREIGLSSVRQADDQRGAERQEVAVARLADGRVLVAGGGIDYAYDAIRWADLYDAAAGRWLPVTPLPEAIGPAAAVAMPDGSAIVVGATREDHANYDPPALVAFGLLLAAPPSTASDQGASGSAPTPPPAGACPKAVTPSSLAAMEPGLRIACFGSRDLVLDADVVIAAGTIIDRVPFETPATLRQVRRPSPEGDYETTWPVVIVDPGSSVGTPATWLPLVVADGNAIPWQLGRTSRLHARFTGHVDDTAASACLRPSTGWPELTDEQAVLVCRSTFVVTRIEPLD
jgi:hypothetical protein